MQRFSEKVRKSPFFISCFLEEGGSKINYSTLVLPTKT
jgi:hypothetical protein